MWGSLQARDCCHEAAWTLGYVVPRSNRDMATLFRGNENLAIRTQDEPHHLYQLGEGLGPFHVPAKLWLHFNCSAKHHSPPLLAAKGCGSRTCQRCPVDDDADPSTVSGCACFCRDTDAEVAGDGSIDRAVVQLPRGLLAAGGALPMLCCAEPGRKSQPLAYL